MQWMLLMSLITFCDMMSSVLILPHLILELICPTQLHPSGSSWVPHLSPECNDTSKSTIIQAADWLNVISRDNNLASLATTFTLTKLGDVVGRKPIALLAAAVLCLDKFLIALSPHPSIVHYVHLACGLFGSTNLYFAVIFSAMADISGHKSRSKDFAWLEAGLFLGMVMGPYTGGFLSKKLGVQMPFYASAAGFLLVCIYILLIKETLPKDKRMRITWGLRACPSSVNTWNNQSEEDPLFGSGSKHSDDNTMRSPDSHPSSSTVVLSSGETSWWMVTPIGALFVLFQSWDWIIMMILMLFNWFGLFGYVVTISLYAKYQFNWGAYDIVSKYLKIITK